MVALLPMLSGCVQQQTRLHSAISYANPEAVEQALNYRAAVNTKDAQGLTPLCLALVLYKRSHLEARRRYFVIVYQLLEAGADPNMACGNTTPLHAAADSHDVTLASLLLSYHPDTEIRDCYGETPLWVAVHRNDLPMAELLLRRGADTNAVDAAGRTPLQMLLQRGKTRTPMLKLLQQYGGR